MLGEAAMTRDDAARYLERYRHAVRAIGAAVPRTRNLFDQPGHFGEALGAASALRVSQAQATCMAELIGPLAHSAPRRATRIFRSPSMPRKPNASISCSMCSRPWAREDALKGWDGLGLAVQAYQKRALPVIAWLADLARRQQRRIIPVRLVKGAYWDSEIKRGQELGLADYPVFTRKAATDVSYLACARALLAAPHLIFPQFATHNAHTLAAIETFAGDEQNLRIPAPARHGRGAVRTL